MRIYDCVADYEDVYTILQMYDCEATKCGPSVATLHNHRVFIASREPTAVLPLLIPQVVGHELLQPLGRVLP